MNYCYVLLSSVVEIFLKFISCGQLSECSCLYLPTVNCLAIVILGGYSVCLKVCNFVSFLHSLFFSAQTAVWLLQHSEQNWVWKIKCPFPHHTHLQSKTKTYTIYKYARRHQALVLFQKTPSEKLYSAHLGKVHLVCDSEDPDHRAHPLCRQQTQLLVRYIPLKYWCKHSDYFTK